MAGNAMKMKMGSNAKGGTSQRTFKGGTSKAGEPGATKEAAPKATKPAQKGPQAKINKK